MRSSATMPCVSLWTLNMTVRTKAAGVVVDGDTASVAPGDVSNMRNGEVATMSS